MVDDTHLGSGSQHTPTNAALSRAPFAGVNRTLGEEMKRQNLQQNTDSTTDHNNHRNRGHRIAGIAAVGLIGLGAALGSAAPAQAKVTTDCSGYGFKCDDTGYGKAAYQSYWTMAPGHNCTNYVAYRLIQDGMPKKITWLHNGGDWAREAKQHGVPVNKVPAVGSVAQWNHGAGGMSSSGHVAYVIAVTPNSITIAEDNYSSGPMAVRTITTNDPGYPSNFIHFTAENMGAKGKANPTAMPVPANDWHVFVADYQRAFDA